MRRQQKSGKSIPHPPRNLAPDRVLHRYYCVCRILLLGGMAELQSCESSTYAISERGAGGLRPGARVRNTSYGANRPAGECRIWSRGTHRNASRLRAARRAEFGVDVEQGDAGATSEPVSIIKLVLHKPSEE